MVQLRDFRIPEDELDNILRSLITHTEEYNNLITDIGNTRALIEREVPNPAVRQPMLDSLDDTISLKKQSCIKRIFCVINSIKEYRI